MLKRGRILMFGLALIGAITLVAGNLWAVSVLPIPGNRDFWMPMTITGTYTVQQAYTGTPPAVKYAAKTVMINNAWIIDDIWYITWGNTSSPPSKTTLYFDGTYAFLCTGGKVGAYDPSCTDVTSTNNLIVSLSVAITNGTWSGQNTQYTQSASGHYLAEIHFNDGFLNYFSGYGVVSEKFNWKYDPNTSQYSGKDTISLTTTGEGFIDSEPITFSIKVSGSGSLIFF